MGLYLLIIPGIFKKGPITCTVVGEFNHGRILSTGTHNIKSWLWEKFYLSTSNPNYLQVIQIGFPCLIQ